MCDGSDNNVKNVQCEWCHCLTLFNGGDDDVQKCAMAVITM